MCFLVTILGRISLSGALAKFSTKPVSQSISTRYNNETANAPAAVTFVESIPSFVSKTIVISTISTISIVPIHCNSPNRFNDSDNCSPL